MAENQNIEYKESWKTEYLDELCSFANTNGGSLFVGIDDKGNVIGVNNTKKTIGRYSKPGKTWLEYFS